MESKKGKSKRTQSRNQSNSKNDSAGSNSRKVKKPKKAKAKGYPPHSAKARNAEFVVRMVEDFDSPHELDEAPIAMGFDTLDDANHYVRNYFRETKPIPEDYDWEYYQLFEKQGFLKLEVRHEFGEPVVLWSEHKDTEYWKPVEYD